MRLIGFLLVFSLVLLLGFSCTKKSDSPNFSLIITDPAEGISINRLDTVKITAIATSKQKMHGYTVRVLNWNTKQQYASFEKTLVSENIVVDEIWIHNIAMGSLPKVLVAVEVSVLVDDSGTLQTKEVLIDCLN